MRFGATSHLCLSQHYVLFPWQSFTGNCLFFVTIHVQYTDTYSIKYRISSQNLAVPLYQNIQNISQGHFVWFNVAL